MCLRVFLCFLWEALSWGPASPADCIFCLIGHQTWLARGPRGLGWDPPGVDQPEANPSVRLCASEVRSLSMVLKIRGRLPVLLKGCGVCAMGAVTRRVHFTGFTWRLFHCLEKWSRANSWTEFIMSSFTKIHLSRWLFMGDQSNNRYIQFKSERLCHEICV